MSSEPARHLIRDSFRFLTPPATRMDLPAFRQLLDVVMELVFVFVFDMFALPWI